MDGLLLAFGFLTVIPVPFLAAPRPGGMGRAAAWFPVVGLWVGAVLAGLAYGSLTLWPDRWIAAALVLMANLVLTGGLHIDGFMDTADAFFSHRDRERMLEIMRDSRSGALGVAGGVVLLVGKFSAVSYLLTAPRLSTLLALALAPALGRAGMVLAIAAFPSARPSGLGASFAAEVRTPHLLVALALAGALAVGVFAWRGAVLFGLAVAVAVLGGLYWKRRLGGLTGDIYGAINEGTELVVLLAAGALLR